MVRVLSPTVALLVVLAGCSAVPGNESPSVPDHRISITIANNHDTSYVFRVTTIPPDVEGIEITYENGSTRAFDVSSFDGLPEEALRNATATTTAGGEDLSKQFTVPPSGGFGTSIRGVPGDSVTVYFVSPADEPETARSVGVVRCDRDTKNTELAVTIRLDGSLHAAVTCTDDSRT